MKNFKLKQNTNLFRKYTKVSVIPLIPDKSPQTETQVEEQGSEKDIHWTENQGTR